MFSWCLQLRRGGLRITKKSVKKVLAPKEEGIQIQVNKGGVAIVEIGSVKSAIVIKEAAKKITAVKCVEPRRMQPRLQIFNVDREMKEKEFLVACLSKI